MENVRNTDNDTSCIGNGSSGNALRVEDGGYVSLYNWKAGYTANSHDNGIFVGSESVLTNRQSCNVGSASGSYSNYLHIAEGGRVHLSKTAYSSLSIGAGDNSHHNEVVVSNGTLVAYNVKVGSSASAHDNVLKILGPKATIDHDNKDVLFNAGHHNRIVLDAGAKQTLGDAKFGTSSVFGYGNTLELINGSSLSCTTLAIGLSGYACNSNRVFVGSGSTLTVTRTASNGVGLSLPNEAAALVVSNATVNAPYVRTYRPNCSLDLLDNSTMSVTYLTLGTTDYAACSNRVFVGAGSVLNIAGVAGGDCATLGSDDCELVVSNGTVYCGYNTWFNFQNTDTSSAHPGTNATIVLQGEAPSITCNDGNYFRFGHGAAACGFGLRFELPPNGYATAPISKAIQFQHGSDLRMTFTGVNTCQRTITAPKDIPLIHTTHSSGLTWLSSAVQKRINAPLPRGCYLKIINNNGSDANDGVTLCLHVRPISGVAIVVR